MVEFFRILLGIFQEAFGGLTGEWFKKVGVPTMIGTLIYATWDILVSPLGPMIFVNCLGVFAAGLLVANEIQARRLQKKWERGELTPPAQKEAIESAQQSIKKLQAKLTAFKDTQPHLTPTVILLRCELYSRVQGSVRSPIVVRGGKVFFLFLRVTNQPKSNNTHAIAKSLYATVRYYDEHGEELRLFPSIEGAWFSLDQESGALKYVEHYPDFPLHPHAYRYLAIALRDSGGGVHDCYAFNVSNLQYSDWVDASLRLPGKTRIEVTLGCHHFSSHQRYTLNDLGPEKGLSLDPMLSPDTSHFSPTNEPR